MSEEKTEGKRDYMQEVTNELIAAMEKGNVPWQKPWDPEVGGNLCPNPFNGKSGKPYTVENAVRLLIKMGEKQSSDPRYFTFNQAQEKGWKVKKGAKATCVRMGFYATKDILGNDLPEEECHWTNRYINVFHASDICLDAEYAKDENGKTIFEDVLDKNGNPVMVDDLDKDGNPKRLEVAYDKNGQIIIGSDGKPVMQPAKRVKKIPKVIYTPIPEYKPKADFYYTHEETMELAEAVLQNSGAKIFHSQGDRAFYESNSDAIYLPPKEAFPSLSGYYATALHELAHWTGHHDRLDRDMNSDKHSTSYAKEELRAELASVFLSMEFGVPVNTTQNAAYLQSWIKNMKDDKKEIFNAANDARKITKYIKELAADKIKEITLNKIGKSEEPDIEIVKQPKPEETQDIPTKETVAEPQTSPIQEPTHEAPTITVTKARITPTNEGIVTEEVSKKEITLTSEPEPAPSCLVISVYNPKDGEFDKEFTYESKGKFKLDDFEKQSVDIVFDANSPEDYFAKYNNHAVGSLVQVDDELFYINNDNNFKRVYALSIDGKSPILAPAANPNKFKEQVIAKIGQEKFDDYKKRFMDMFRNGAATDNIEFTTENLDLAYSKFIYDNAVKFGVSSNNPLAAKQWKDANEGFMQTCIKEFGANNAILDVASKIVKDICPVKVDAEALALSAVNSNAFQQLKNNENIQIAAYGAR